MKPTKHKMPQPAKPKNAKPVGTQFGPEPSKAAAMPKGLKKLPSIGQPKSPAATVTGQRVKKMPEFPSWGAPATGQRIHKLPSLSDPKMSNPKYNGGT